MSSRIGTEVARFDGSVRLGSDQLDAFRARGFLALPDLLAPDEVEHAATIVRALLHDPLPRDEGMLLDYAGVHGDPDHAAVLQLLLPFDYAPALFDTAFFMRAAALAHALLAPPVRYRGSHYVRKPPGRDNPTPFHQDEAYWEPSSLHEAIAVWMPLAAVGHEHGCMQFVARPVGDETIFSHRHLGGDARVHGLELEPGVLETRDAIACPLPLGGVTVHHCRNVHGTGPNHAAAAREALVVNFAGPERPLPAARDFAWQRELDNARDRERRDRGIELP